MSNNDRLHALDAVRAGALLLGVVFHAGFSFIPGMIAGIWAFDDNSPSTSISVLVFVSHIFRMSLFFFIAGFFARMMFQKKGARGLLGRPLEADPGADDGRLGRAVPVDRGRLDLGYHQVLRGRAALIGRLAWNAGAAAARVPDDAPVVPLGTVPAVRARCRRPQRRREARLERFTARVRGPS